MFHTPQQTKAQMGEFDGVKTGDDIMKLVHGSNDDRKWFAAAQKAARVLALKAAGLAENEEATSQEARDLIAEVQKAQGVRQRQWEKIKQKYVQENKEEALAEAEPLWQRIAGLLQGAATNAASRIVPSSDPLGVSHDVTPVTLTRRTPRSTGARPKDTTRVLGASEAGARVIDALMERAEERGRDTLRGLTSEKKEASTMNAKEPVLELLAKMQEAATAQQNRMEELERSRSEESREVRRQLEAIRHLYLGAKDEDSFRGEAAASKVTHTYGQATSTPLPTAGRLTVSSIDEMCPGGIYDASASKNGKRTPGGAHQMTSTNEKGPQQSRLKTGTQTEKNRVRFNEEQQQATQVPQTHQAQKQSAQVQQRQQQATQVQQMHQTQQQAPQAQQMYQAQQQVPQVPQVQQGQQPPAHQALQGHQAQQVLQMHPIVARFAREIPNYQQRPAVNVYATITGQATPEWYETELQDPWNVRPVENNEPFVDLRKLEPHCPKFTGNDADYPAWVCSFLPNIHRANAAVGLKAQCLYKCFNKEDPRLQEMIKRLGNSKEDYARVLHRLTRTYGHPEGILAARLQAIEEIGAVSAADPLTMEKWLMRMEDYCDTAIQLGRAEDIMSMKLYNENVSKLDDTQALLYREWVKWNAPRRDLPSLVAWLEERVQNLRDLERQKKMQKEAQGSQQRAMTTTTDGPKRSRVENNEKEKQLTRQAAGTCPMDGEKHPLFRCDLFKKLKPDDRRDMLDDWKRCYSCLMSGHQMSTCKKGITCHECKKNHHTLLHGSRMGRPRRNKPRVFVATETDEWSEDSEEEDDEVIMKSTVDATKIALQTIPITLYNPRNKKQTDLNLLIDPGCTGAFLSTRAAKELELEGEIGETTITGFGGLKKKTKIAVATVQVSAIGRRKRHWVQVRITEDPASSYWPHDWSQEVKTHQHLQGLPVSPPVPNKPVDIMIGMSNPELISSMEQDREGDREGLPVARKTRLGWVVGGPTGRGSQDQAGHVAFFKNFVPEDSIPMWERVGFKDGSFMQEMRSEQKMTKTAELALETAVHRMWETENAVGEKKIDPMEGKVMKWLEDNVKKDGPKYELPTIWKDPEARPKNNYWYANKRMKGLTSSKYFKDRTIREQYLAHKEEWVKEDQIEKVDTETPEKDKAYYLPHQAVVRLDKATTKVRPVMDGRAKAGKEAALNEYLLKGPKLINELPGVFLRFRARPVAIAADVKQMFYQIQMKKEDRDWHRFLWPGEDGEEIYRWKVHPFGSAASPCIAIFVIKHHGRKMAEKFPRAAEMVIHSTLVDDNLDSVDTEEEAIQLLRDAQELYEEAGMKLRKIISSSKVVLEAFPEQERSPSMDIAQFCTKDLDLPLVKTLGVIYLSGEDAFSFHMEKPNEHKWTKRTILRYEATLYDPHGFLSPYIVAARILLQKLWREKVGWDDKLPEKIGQEWQRWLDALSHLSQLRIPRCIVPTTEANIVQKTIHVFCDASGDAYGAVAYMRTVQKDGQIHTSLLLSKARVAPIHQVSIPRLELMASQIALDVANQIIEALGVERDKVCFWSDSINVLFWIKGDSRSLNSFVGTRIAKIQTQTKPQQWRWVDTKQNPADLPSRGQLAGELLGQELWWKGPTFLRSDTQKWPVQPRLDLPTDEALQEVKKSAAFVFHSVPTSLKDGFTTTALPTMGGTWTKVVRVTARILRWKNKMRGPLGKSELAMAEKTIIRVMQAEALALTRKQLQAAGQTTKMSRVHDLRPMLDGEGILRANGRLRDAKFLAYDVRHPILIPKDHKYTELIIAKAHIEVLHAGVQHTHAHLLRKYWIVKGTGTIKRALRSCIACRRQKSQPEMPQQATLPSCRLPEGRVRPFERIGLDMAGPYYIWKGKEKVKHYFVIYTCLVYRAVHLEELPNANTSAFLRALDRFTARRGEPSFILSDNGSNFLGARNELRKLQTREAREEIANLRPNQVWEFTPPKGPHFGGIYERLIKSVKMALYHVFPGKYGPTADEFRTALVVVEGMMNSRPLTYVSAERGLSPLTPSHYLGISQYEPLSLEPEQGWNLQKQWQVLQQRLDMLWKRLCMEIRPHLQKMTKWRKEGVELQKGDIVAVMDEKRRGKWPLGRIVETEASHDGRIRRVLVLSGGATYRRPASAVLFLLAPEVEEKRLLESFSDGHKRSKRPEVPEEDGTASDGLA